MANPNGSDIQQTFLRRQPALPLHGLVTGLFAYDEGGAAMRGAVETASLTVPLIFNFASPFKIALGRAPSPDERYGSFTAGLFAGPVIMDSDGGAQCIQVNFTPRGGRMFFGRPMSELTGQMAGLDAFGDRAISEMERRLGEMNDWDARLDLVERFIAARLADAPPVDRGVSWAFDTVLRRRGNLRISSLTQSLGWSRRRLVERFRQDFGLPPKQVARIVRFNAAKAMASAGETDWADVAFGCGYADQSHLVREFSELAGASPTAWRAPA